jgi:hypothetical protein
MLSATTLDCIMSEPTIIDPPSLPDKPLAVTVTSACFLTGLSPAFIWQAIHDERLKAYRPSTWRTLVDYRSLLDFLQTPPPASRGRLGTGARKATSAPPVPTSRRRGRPRKPQPAETIRT